MPRLFACALIGALVLGALAPAAPVPQHLMKLPDYYFPTKVGTKLEYEEPGSEVVNSLVVTAVADRDGVKIVSVGQETANGIQSYSTMLVTGGGLYRLERGGQKFDTPEVWLKLPTTRNLSWDYPTGDPTVIPRAVVANSIGGKEDVTVPAGTFRCIRVETRHNGRAAKCWFAPNVGLVKIEAATWTEVLKSYTPGKD